MDDRSIRIIAYVNAGFFLIPADIFFVLMPFLPVCLLDKYYTRKQRKAEY